MFDFFFLINVTNVVMKESLWFTFDGDARGLSLRTWSMSKEPLQGGDKNAWRRPVEVQF
jgi:hypothetical protein